MFNGSELIKASATKFPNRNQNFYQSYKIFDNSIHDLENTREEIDKEFVTWLEFAKKISKYVGVNPSRSRSAKCWIKFGDNTQNKSPEIYYKGSIAFLLWIV